MQVKIFNKEYEVKDHHCNFNDSGAKKIEEPYVNLYVRLTEECQAHCHFCEFHMNRNIIFNKYKFLYTFARLNKEIKINKISFTGGEPTLRIELLNELLKEIKEINPKIFTVVNTNGYRFKEIDAQYVDSIALSRHAKSNAMNNTMFGLDPYGIWVSDTLDIKNYPHKEKLHLSCNLIEGMVYSQDGCFNYINYFGDMGITDIGFVSLMPVNDYAKEHQIDFTNLDLGSMKNTIKAQHWSNKNVCKCANFLTSTSKGTIVKSYARYYCDRTECKGILVYEPDGRLTTGFGGEVIYE
jgi:molybdenum cofactor biosynthesis enzyme MoaA